MGNGKIDEKVWKCSERTVPKERWGWQHQHSQLLRDLRSMRLVAHPGHGTKMPSRYIDMPGCLHVQPGHRQDESYPHFKCRTGPSDPKNCYLTSLQALGTQSLVHPKVHHLNFTSPWPMKILKYFQTIANFLTFPIIYTGCSSLFHRLFP